LASRWTLSNVGHQGTKVPADELGDFIEWLMDYEHVRLGIPRPFYAILNVPTSVVFPLLENSRHEFKDGHELNHEHLIKAEWIYKRLSGMSFATMINCAEGDQFLSKEAVHDLVWRNIRGLLPPKASK
jgi:dTMP kinase